MVHKRKPLHKVLITSSKEGMFLPVATQNLLDVSPRNLD